MQLQNATFMLFLFSIYNEVDCIYRKIARKRAFAFWKVHQFQKQPRLYVLHKHEHNPCVRHKRWVFVCIIWWSFDGLLKTGWCLHFSQTRLHILQQSPALCKSSPKCFGFSFPSNKNSSDEDTGSNQTFPVKLWQAEFFLSASLFSSCTCERQICCADWKKPQTLTWCEKLFSLFGNSHFSYSLSAMHEWCMLQKQNKTTTIKTWAGWTLI